MTTVAPRPIHHSPDETDKTLLNALQAGLPLSRSPYADLGADIGLDEGEVLRRLDVLRRAAIVRQISAIFDTRALGYTSMLVAAKYPDDKLHEGAAIVGGHPGVSHNYRRTHDFNLWFTLAVEPDARLGLEDTIDILTERTGAISMRMLPTLKLFKINVQLDMTGEAAGKVEAPKPPPTRGDGVLPTEEDRRFICILQRDLPGTSDPFGDWAAEAGVDPDALLEYAERFRERNYMRRFAAVLNHRRAGFGANGMAVWRVPEDRIEEIGSLMAGFRSVSHCYRRPTYPDWPYNVFSMVHSRSKDACEEVIQAIADETGLTAPDDRAVLYSTLEYKKIRLVYYTPEYRAWEDIATAGGELPRWGDEPRP